MSHRTLTAWRWADWARAGAGLTRRPGAATMADMRTSPPFRADHVGSLLRPPDLLTAREDFAAGRISAAQLRAAEDAAIADAARMQAETGLHTVTDGEFRRASWHMDFIYQLGGINHAADHITVQFRNTEGTI